MYSTLERCIDNISKPVPDIRARGLVTTPDNGNSVENQDGSVKLPKALDCGKPRDHFCIEDCEKPRDQFWFECGMDVVGLKFTPGCKEEVETAPVGLTPRVFVNEDQDWTSHDVYVLGLILCAFDPGGQDSTQIDSEEER